MRSQANNTVEIKKHVNLGHMPLFVSMIHRHLEKGQPNGTPSTFGSVVNFTVSKDLLRLSVSNEDLLKDIDEITFTYCKRA